MQAAEIIKTIYQDIDGFAISANAMETSPFYYIGMIYDEVSLPSFLEVLVSVNPQKGDIFYDLGCGVGEKVIAAAHTFPFIKSVGIELVQDLFTAARAAQVNYNNLVPVQSSTIEFLHKDFNQHNFSDGDIFFLSLTQKAMEIELYGRLKNKLEKLKKGARLITTDIPFLSPYFSYIEFPTADFKRGLHKEKALFFLHTKIA